MFGDKVGGLVRLLNCLQDRLCLRFGYARIFEFLDMSKVMVVMF